MKKEVIIEKVESILDGDTLREGNFSTTFLSLMALPLIMLGNIIYWPTKYVVKKINERKTEKLGLETAAPVEHTISESSISTNAPVNTYGKKRSNTLKLTRK